MNDKLFRKKSIDKMVSPEQIDQYIRVSNPAVWMILAAIIFLLAGACIWGIFGRLDTTVSVAAVHEDGVVQCYVKEADAASIEENMMVEINGKEYHVTSLEKEPITVDSSVKDYAKHLGKLSDGEWVYIVTTDCSAGDEGDVFSANIIVERVNPLHFILN